MSFSLAAEAKKKPPQLHAAMHPHECLSPGK